SRRRGKALRARRGRKPSQVFATAAQKDTRCLGRELINCDCPAIAGCRKTTGVAYARRSGDLPPPSPRAEKTTARQDQARQASARRRLFRRGGPQRAGPRQRNIFWSLRPKPAVTVGSLQVTCSRRGISLRRIILPDGSGRHTADVRIAHVGEQRRSLSTVLTHIAYWQHIRARPTAPVIAL